MSHLSHSLCAAVKQHKAFPSTLSCPGIFLLLEEHEPQGSTLSSAVFWAVDVLKRGETTEAVQCHLLGFPLQLQLGKLLF